MFSEKIEKRPIVTFVLIAFQQANFIREATIAALNQDYNPLEIILSDDCSLDRTFEVMQELVAAYVGPHRIRLNKNEENYGAQGMGRHVNKLLSMATGELIVFAAGDDWSAPNRTSQLVSLWMSAGRPSGSLHSAAETLADSPSASGRLIRGDQAFGEQTILECVRKGATGVLGATHAITRDIYQIFGPLPCETLFEDRTLAFRSLLVGRVLYCSEILVKYRTHGANVSGHEIYTDSVKWSRWADGLVAKYKSFRIDYLTSLKGRSPDTRILRQINQGEWRSEKSRLLVDGNRLQRFLAGYFYSNGLKISDRVAFLCWVTGVKETALYRGASWIWRLRKLFK
jgi:glycosyltransferase involved in cell wall biosynthesis